MLELLGLLPPLASNMLQRPPTQAKPQSCHQLFKLRLLPLSQLRQRRPTSQIEREAEQDLIKDGPAKHVKTNGSKKVERQAKGQGDHPPPAVYASELPKSSKHSKSSKLSEASKPSKPDDKKRNPVEEQELGAESSGQTKGVEKTDSAINAPQPMPTTPKSVN
jgi:hypothetical protein